MNYLQKNINCKELLAQFDDKREALILVYLFFEADEEGKVHSSIYALARQLNMHRQTLTRIINRLCEKGYTTWETTAAPGQRHLLYVTLDVTDGVTKDVTKDVTDGVTKDVTDGVTKKVTCSDEKNDSTTHSQSSRCNNTEDKTATSAMTLYMTQGVTQDVTQGVTTKEETKEKKEENPPAPPQEEKKQKKEENSPSPGRAREKNPRNKTTDPSATLEQRRQRFMETLSPYTDRYGEEMIRHFAEYWTEANRSLTRMRFEMQPTWSTHLRLARWARNEQSFHQNNNCHDSKHNFTSADYIREAQLHAINATEEFIRQAEIRRGGIPPHLPY